MMGYNYYADGVTGYWGMGIGSIFMVFWWVLIIAGIIVFVKWASRGFHGCGGGTHEKSAIEILKERYAKGEIEKEEFAEKKKDLG